MGRKGIAKINFMVLQYGRNSNLLAQIKCSVQLIVLRMYQSISDVSQFPNVPLPSCICFYLFFFEYLDSSLFGARVGFSSCVQVMPHCSPCSLPTHSGNLYHSKFSSFDFKVQRPQELFSFKESCKERFVNTCEVLKQFCLVTKWEVHKFICCALYSNGKCVENYK